MGGKDSKESARHEKEMDNADVIQDTWEDRCAHPTFAGGDPHWCEMMLSRVLAEKREDELWENPADPTDGKPKKPKEKTKLNGKEMAQVKKKCAYLNAKYGKKYKKKIPCTKGWAPTLLFKYLVNGPDTSSTGDSNPKAGKLKRKKSGGKGGKKGVKRSVLATDSSTSVASTVSIILAFLIVAAIIGGLLYYLVFYKKSKKEKQNDGKGAGGGKGGSKKSGMKSRAGKSKSTKSKAGSKMTGSKKSKKSKSKYSKSGKSRKSLGKKL